MLLINYGNSVVKDGPGINVVTRFTALLTVYRVPPKHNVVLARASAFMHDFKNSLKSGCSICFNREYSSCSWRSEDL